MAPGSALQSGELQHDYVGPGDPALLAPPRTVRVAFDDGSFVLRSPEPLRPYARCVGEWIERWARETPDAPAFAERLPGGDGWRRLTWRQTRELIGRIGQ